VKGGGEMAFFEDGKRSGILDKQCQACPFQSTQCPVYMVQGLYNFEQMRTGQQNLRDCLTFLVDDAGKCRVREMLQHVCQDVSDYCTIQQCALMMSALKKQAAS